MLLRPTNLGNCLNVVAFTACTFILAVVCTILYGTRAEQPRLPNLVKEVLPAGRCQCESSTVFTCSSCLDCAPHQSHIRANTTAGDELWSFSFQRDANNYGLDEKQCQTAFPGLYEDLERARSHREATGNITEAELGSFTLTKGMVRALVYRSELYILETFLVDNVNREKAVAALAALHRALVSSPARATIPDIEFVLSVEDLPAQPNKPIWSLTRRVADEELWLMPDFGFWSWDMPELGSFSEVAAEAIHSEAVQPWERKIEKLVWRGKVTYAPKLRHALLDAARGKPWSDVGQVQWGDDASFQKQFLGPIDQCDYMFIAHAEGRSYSGALKYRQLCRSVIVAHELQWIQHYHYLLVREGPRQNYVEVRRDFADLSEKMEDLLAHPTKAKRIADNSVATFRERYLTPAAEACYWRALIKSYRKVLDFEPSLYNSGEDGKRSGILRRGVRFETFVYL
ncbi:hypothetical protein M011DRAFT_467553 [Sporormia fimetaria CBS 119925]|uniref:Glycosyl transferase CAP10 domain-containing protein n=1 Tax=Sporormia fimetaria CBS 119925 TaxID=1340428 RepID=A0A6A6VA30_9PLEO|nr:hypothetical protein M011DRAFT_467553 [Sporormia fimetaria CBS 119925]